MIQAPDCPGAAVNVKTWDACLSKPRVGLIADRLDSRTSPGPQKSRHLTTRSALFIASPGAAEKSETIHMADIPKPVVLPFTTRRKSRTDLQRLVRVYRTALN